MSESFILCTGEKTNRALWGNRKAFFQKEVTEIMKYIIMICPIPSTGILEIRNVANGSYVNTLTVQ